jgi:hypothetical protein
MPPSTGWLSRFTERELQDRAMAVYFQDQQIPAQFEIRLVRKYCCYGAAE